MNGSWELGRLAGIRVQVHWTFLLLPALIAWTTWSTAGSAAAIASVVFVLSVFGCVVLHELGHALAARRYGIETRDITLLPIGGVARLERLPREPLQELVIALAGPAVNVVIAAAIFAGLFLAGHDTSQFLQAETIGASFLLRLMWTNVALLLFNLLPAFPMDGGRVLRALLAIRLPYGQATQVAASVGRAVAILFAVIGLFSNWTLMLIAAFVYFAGRSEEATAQTPTASAGVNVGDVMQRQFQTVSAETRLAELAPRLPLMTQRDFPVIDQNRLVGMVSGADVLAAVAQGDFELTVAQIMQRGVPTVDRRESLLESVLKMQSMPVESIPVSDGGVLVGILARDQINRWLQSLNSKSRTHPLGA